MKKTTTLTLALLLSCIGAGAKNMEFRFQGKTLANADTITLQAVETETGITASTNENGNNAVLVNVSGMAIKGEGTLYVISNPDLVNLQWCVGTNCTPTTTKSISKTAYLSKDEQIKLMFDANFDKESTVLVLLTFTRGTEIDSLYIRSVFSTSAVHSAASQTQLSISGREISYSFANGGTPALRVYSMQGKLMVKRTLNQQGTTSLATLPKGTYICDVTQKNKHIVTRKIIVE